MRDAAVKARNGGAHRSTHVRWWQAVSAVVPITLVAGAWGVAITASPGSGSETIDAKLDDTPSQPGTPAITDVPTDAFDKPMAGQVKKSQSGRHPLADVKQASKNVAASAQSSPLPTPALDAYRSAAKVMADVKASCNLDWTLVAAIGRVESDHGQYGGSKVATSGVSSPKIIGIPLDGTNETAAIRDTDDGRFDGDRTWDRAVGPMQFIPSTWNLVGVDGNADGTKDPNNIYDAALASAVYLCADGEDLSTREGASEAVFSYNHSNDYVANVLAIAAAYERGDFKETPGYYPDVDTGPADGTVFDPDADDDWSKDDQRPDDPEKQKKLLESVEGGPSKSKHSKESNLLKPIDKRADDKQGKDKSHGPGKNKSQEVKPARPDDQGQGHALIKPGQLQTVVRDGARPTKPKGNHKSGDVKGFADDRSGNKRRDGSGSGRLGKLQLQQKGPAVDVRPDRDGGNEGKNRDGGADSKNGPTGTGKSQDRKNNTDKSGDQAQPKSPKGDDKDGNAKPKSNTGQNTSPKTDGNAKPKANTGQNTSPKTDGNAKPKANTGQNTSPKTDGNAKPKADTGQNTSPKTDGNAKPKADTGQNTSPKTDGNAKPKSDTTNDEAQPKSGNGQTTRPDADGAKNPTQPKTDGKTQPKSDVKPRHRGESKPEADGPGVNVRPKHRAESKPGAPKKQSAPTKPKQQRAPAKPKQQAAPAKPKQQSAPAKPKQQSAPAKPKQQSAPAKPKQQSAPAKPKQQAAPTKPKQQAAPTKPKQQAAPTKPKQQSAPAKPKQQAAPTKPKQQSAPAKPKQQAAPTKPKNKKKTRHGRSAATKTAPASTTTYLPGGADAETLVAQFLDSYALFWSVPVAARTVDSL